MATRLVKEFFMSLRKSPLRTAAFLAAHRRNAWKSTGPRTIKGKLRSSLNALKHGRFAHHLLPKLRAASDPRLYEGVRGLTRGYLPEWVANTAACSIWKASLRARRSLQASMKNFPGFRHRPPKSQLEESGLRNVENQGNEAGMSFGINIIDWFEANFEGFLREKRGGK